MTEPAEETSKIYRNELGVDRIEAIRRMTNLGLYYGMLL